MDRPGTRGSQMPGQQRPGTRGSGMPLGAMSQMASGSMPMGSSSFNAPPAAFSRPPGTASGRPLGTAAGQIPPSTASFRPGTASQRPSTASLRPDLRINDRPVTQQGMSGLKTTNAGPGRMVYDRSFYLGELRSKARDLTEAIDALRSEAEQFATETPAFQKLDKSRTALTSEVKRLRSELLAINACAEVSSQSTPPAEIAGQAMAIEERNKVERRKLESIVRERTNMERKTQEMNVQLTNELAAIEERLAELPMEAKRKYATLQGEEQYLVQERARLEEQVRGMDNAVGRAEAAVRGHVVKERALALAEIVRGLLDKKYELENDERRMQLPPDVQREQIKAQMKRDNADVVRIETTIRELAEEIKGLEGKVQHYTTMKTEVSGGAGGGGAVGGQQAVADMAEKWNRLLQQEIELHSFLSSYPQHLDEAERERDEREARILSALGDAARGETLMVSNASSLMTADQVRSLRDEQDYKQAQLENAKRTAEQLKGEEAARRADLDKLDGIEAKIAAETNDLKKKLLVLKSDLAQLGSADKVRVKVEERRAMLELQRESLRRRRDLMKKMANEKQQRVEARMGQLQQSEAHVRLNRLENSFRQVEQRNQQMRNAIIEKTVETDFGVIVDEIAELTNRVNQETQRYAAM